MSSFTRSWEETSKAGDAARADEYQLARHALSLKDHPYDWTPSQKTEVTYRALYKRESRHRGILGLCSDPTMIKECCTSDLNLQRIPEIETLCRTRANIRD